MKLRTRFLITPKIGWGFCFILEFTIIQATHVDLSLLKICAKFVGKVARKKQVRGKKKYLSRNKLSFDSFSLSSAIYVYVSKYVVINYANN